MDICMYVQAPFCILQWGLCLWWPNLQEECSTRTCPAAAARSFSKVYFLCLTEEKQVNMINLHPLFNHEEQDKLYHLDCSSQISLRPELVRYV